MRPAIGGLGYSRHEAVGVVTASTRGTAVPSSTTTANAKGVWTTIGTASFDYDMIQVEAHSFTAFNHCIDIGIDDGSGNTFVLCPDLGLSGGLQVAGISVMYQIPIHIPAGAVIKCRQSRNNSATGDIRFSIHGFSAAPGGSPPFSRLISLYTPTTSRGPTVDASGTAHTLGAYTELASSSSLDIEALILCFGQGGDADRGAILVQWLVDISIGASGSEQVILSQFPLTVAGLLSAQPLPMVLGPLPVFVPAGSRFACRTQCNVNTAGDRGIDVRAWGLVR